MVSMASYTTDQLRVMSKQSNFRGKVAKQELERRKERYKLTQEDIDGKPKQSPKKETKTSQKSTQEGSGTSTEESSEGTTTKKTQRSSGTRKTTQKKTKTQSSVDTDNGGE